MRLLIHAILFLKNNALTLTKNSRKNHKDFCFTALKMHRDFFLEPPLYTQDGCFCWKKSARGAEGGFFMDVFGAAPLFKQRKANVFGRFHGF